jgi:hypothetical protein
MIFLSWKGIDMFELKDTLQTVYRVYNLTNLQQLSDFEEKSDLKEYLNIIRANNPEDNFVVYRVCTHIAYDKMDW